MILRLEIILSIVSYERKDIIFHETNFKLMENDTFSTSITGKKVYFLPPAG